MKIIGLKFINTAESYIGDILIKGNSAIVPFFNVYLTPDDCNIQEPFRGKFIRNCYLQFEGVSAIYWNYEMSKAIPADERECYGGVHFNSKEDVEFWIKYNSGFVLYNENVQVSKNSFRIVEDDIRFLNQVEF